MPKIPLEIWNGGAKNPRIFGTGVPIIGDADYPMTPDQFWQFQPYMYSCALQHSWRARAMKRAFRPAGQMARLIRGVTYHLGPHRNASIKGRVFRLAQLIFTHKFTHMYIGWEGIYRIIMHI